jgi:four helix bundle protein
MFKFEKLVVWQESILLSKSVHDISRKFPKDELFILTSQIKRAADSVALNVAEGSTGQTNLEFRRFLAYAIRSAIEVVSCLFIAKERHIISESDFKLIYSDCEKIIKMLQALRKSIKE